MNDSRYPWVILVPRIADARELHDLSDADGTAVWAEVMAIASALGDWRGIDKVNIGALGNIVSQLHVHVIGRSVDDPAWPGPVWGHSEKIAYEDGHEAELMAFLTARNSCLPAA